MRLRISSPDKAAKQFAESIRPILDRADRLGIDVGIECEPGLLLEYVAELAEWIERLDHPRYGANLDIGHSQVMGEDLHEAIHQFGARIRMYQPEAMDMETAFMKLTQGTTA